MLSKSVNIQYRDARGVATIHVIREGDIIRIIDNETNGRVTLLAGTGPGSGRDLQFLREVIDDILKEA